MNDTKNRLVCYDSQLPDSNTSCVPAFATRFSQPISNEVEKPSSATEGEKTQGKKEKIFPWTNSFSKQCCAAVGDKTVKQLENLLNSYVQHVTPHYNECQKLPNKAFKLKRNINETMVFLHLLYSDLHEPLENGIYHEKMAEVMAMYLDLEITAFRRGKDTVKEVYNRLSSTLYTLLDRSDDHILDALLRTQLVNKHSKNLCGPFLRKVLTEFVLCRPLSALTYVRYVLAFKLWKNVVADANEKKNINKIALQRLHPPPKFFQDHDVANPSAKILPKVPKSKKNCSQFYLQAKFSLKDACRAFFRFCKETNCQEEPVYLPAFSEKTEEVENNGCLSLIDEIWSSMSSDTFDDMPLRGKSEEFSEDQMFCDHTTLCESDEVFFKAELPPSKVESPDSGVCLGLDERHKRKRSSDAEADKVPDSTDVMFPDSQELKSGGDESTDASLAPTVSETASPEPSSTVPGAADLSGAGISSQSPSSSVVSADVLTEIKGECPEDELPSSSRLQQPEATYVAVEEASVAYQEVLRGGDLSYSDVVVNKPADADDADSRNLASNCHLPLKKRKLAASSDSSTDSKPYSSPYSDSDYQAKALGLAVREEKRPYWDSPAEFDSRWRTEAPADLRRGSFDLHQQSLPSSPVAKLDRAHGSPHVAEVPDNLTILAEEAARIWEERAQGELAPFGMVAPQANLIPQGRMMMSIAEALENPNQKKLEESVIVRNDQYHYYKEQSRNAARQYANTQYHPGSNKVQEVTYERRNDRANGEKPQDLALRPQDLAKRPQELAKRPQDLAKKMPPVKEEVQVNGGYYREHKPIDMSGKHNSNAGLPYSQSVHQGVKASICQYCQSGVCKGMCRVTQSRTQVTPVRVCSCKSPGCNGNNCKAVSQTKAPSVHQADARKSYPNASGEQKKYKKCHYCKNSSCEGACRSAAKLKCALCKSAQCNGSCKAAVCQYCRKSGCDSSRCLIESKKCDCKSPSCKGKCKANQSSSHKKVASQEVHTYPPTKIAKCNYCKSTCFGTCRLAEKNQQRCSLCNAAACKGKCAQGTCSLCRQKKCTGACWLNHSVDSILGSTSKAASSGTSRRRTRNSQPTEQTKTPRTPVQAAPESKRRKKSVSR